MGPQRVHCYANGWLFMQFTRCRTAISQGFSSWIMKLNGRFCTLLHSSHKSSSRAQAQDLVSQLPIHHVQDQAPCLYISALVSRYPWNKRLTHSRESFRIQTRHEVIQYFKYRTLALSPPKVFSSRCLSKGLKAAQWRKQSPQLLWVQD